MRLRLRDRVLVLEPGRPLLMGIVNATPDSFSDPGRRSLPGLVAMAHGQVEAGATLIDVGGQSGRTDRAPVSARVETARVLPLVERLAGEGLLVSVDTWRSAVARAALRAGASMVNDASGLSDPGIAEACAESGAALVITHTRLPPKRKGFPRYANLLDDVRGLWQECAREAARR
jgi:dihydropteroate synthase